MTSLSLKKSEERIRVNKQPQQHRCSLNLLPGAKYNLMANFLSKKFGGVKEKEA